MSSHPLNLFAALLLVLLAASTAAGQTIHASGTYKGAAPGWDRGMETTMHCGNSPESWVRGAASLEKSTGILSITLQLETDSILAGPKGRVQASIRDAKGQEIYRAVSDEIGMGGKPPGPAAIKNFSSTISVPLPVSAAAASLFLDAQCTGSVTGLFNLDPVNINHNFVVVASNPLEHAPASPAAMNLVADAFSKASAVSTPGTPQYTANLRRNLAQPGQASTVNAPITSLDNDPRYRSNFTDPTRVYGGSPVAPGTFPDTVAITGNGDICTGVVIGEQSILTAAHCYCGGVSETVYFGDTYATAINTAKVASGVSMIACSTGMDLQKGDVAILRLAVSLTVPPRAFASSSLIDAVKTARVVGFGQGMDLTSEPAGIKRLTDVPVESSKCSGTVPSPSGNFPDSDYYHCAAGQEMVAGARSWNKDTCHGDSGGPLYVTGPDGGLYLAATTSRATATPGMRPCGDGGIYVRTDGAVLAWLQQQGIHIFVGPIQ
jgi:Trypsin